MASYLSVRSSSRSVRIPHVLGMSKTQIFDDWLICERIELGSRHSVGIFAANDSRLEAARVRQSAMVAILDGNELDLNVRVLV